MIIAVVILIYYFMVIPHTLATVNWMWLLWLFYLVQSRVRNHYQFACGYVYVFAQACTCTYFIFEPIILYVKNSTYSNISAIIINFFF